MVEPIRHENHALIAYELGNEIHVADDISEEETKSETYIPDLNARHILWLIWKMIL